MAADKSGAKWTVVGDVWTPALWPAALEFTVTGLAGGVSYDVQVRAVNASGGGAWSATTTGTPTTGAATVASVVAGDAALTVVWDTPAGVPASSVTAYDLRYKTTSGSTWTVKDSVWTSGGEPLPYVLAGLVNGASYDVQVRAVTSSDGAWSATAAGTPAEHGGTAASAAALAVGVPLGGKVQSSSDKDFFKFTLKAQTQLVLHTSGPTDTEAKLYNSKGGIAMNKAEFIAAQRTDHGVPHAVSRASLGSG